VYNLEKENAILRSKEKQGMGPLEVRRVARPNSQERRRCEVGGPLTNNSLMGRAQSLNNSFNTARGSIGGFLDDSRK